MVRGTVNTRQAEGTKMIVLSNRAKDLAMSFDNGRVSDTGTVRTHEPPARTNTCGQAA